MTMQEGLMIDDIVDEFNHRVIRAADGAIPKSSIHHENVYIYKSKKKLRIKKLSKIMQVLLQTKSQIISKCES